MKRWEKWNLWDKPRLLVNSWSHNSFCYDLHEASSIICITVQIKSLTHTLPFLLQVKFNDYFGLYWSHVVSIIHSGHKLIGEPNALEVCWW